MYYRPLPLPDQSAFDKSPQGTKYHGAIVVADGKKVFRAMNFSNQHTDWFWTEDEIVASDYKDKDHNKCTKLRSNTESAVYKTTVNDGVKFVNITDISVYNMLVRLGWHDKVSLENKRCPLFYDSSTQQLVRNSTKLDEDLFKFLSEQTVREALEKEYNIERLHGCAVSAGYGHHSEIFVFTNQHDFVFALLSLWLRPPPRSTPVRNIQRVQQGHLVASPNKLSF